MVPREPFQTGSTVFRDMFLLPQGETVEGLNDERPIKLDGRIRTAVEGPPIQVRISLHPTLTSITIPGHCYISEIMAHRLACQLVLLSGHRYSSYPPCGSLMSYARQPLMLYRPPCATIPLTESSSPVDLVSQLGCCLP